MSNNLERSTLALGPGESFDTVVVPHLDAAYRLARWLMRDPDVADDVVQEASLRAFRYFRTFVGGDGRAWFLKIVRNTCYGWRRRGYQPPTDPFDDEQHSSAQSQSDPETLLLQTDDAAVIAQALSRLPAHFHQLLVLRELEGLSYRELSDVIGIPMGTVMSRLSRAREALRSALDAELPQPGISSGPHPREPSQRRYWCEPRGPREEYAKSRWNRPPLPQRRRQRPLHMQQENSMKKYVRTLGIALTLALPHAAPAQGLTPPPVPTNIEVQSPNEGFLPAVGTQNSQGKPVSSLGRKAGAIPWLEIDVERTRFQAGLSGGGTLGSNGSRQAPRSNRSGARPRSKKRIVAGAIAGGVGGFFAGGFLGAHIEGDRCDCDDPGVRGFLTGAPIGAVAGAIAGAKFVF